MVVALAFPSSSAVAQATLASSRSRCGSSPRPSEDADTSPSMVASNLNQVPVAVAVEVAPHAAGELAEGHLGDLVAAVAAVVARHDVLGGG